MRFSIISFLPLLSVLVAALPIPDNASSQKANNLGNGINKGLDDSNKELDAINNLDSVEKNNPTQAQTSAAIAQVQTSLNEAKSQRITNQKLASRRNSAVEAGLAKVATAQEKAQAAINTLNGGPGDAATAASLKATFLKGQATNEANLAAAVGNQ